MSVIAPIGTYIASAAGTLVAGLALRWYDRKLTARLQWRKGPPWYQPIADVLKLLLCKETLVPSTARGTGFLLAPVIALSSVALVAGLLWSVLIYHTTVVGDLIVVIYLLIIPPLMTILGASASGSPHAAVGASREMKLILCYELPFVLALLVPVIHAKWSLQLNEIAGVTTLYSISGVIAMIVAIFAAQAKLGQVPFDIAEAECEIMGGVVVEYSGAPLAMIYLTRAMMLAVMPLLLITVFWGGIEFTFVGILAFIGKYLLLVTITTLIRNTNPRLRIDQAMRFYWMTLTPAAVIAVILAIIGYSRAIGWL